jgi:DNA primase
MTRTKRAILTEGYMDVISLHQFGYTDSCGVLGTALTADQVKRLAGFCSRVDLVFDGDGAGRKAAMKSSRMILLQGVACKVVLMPDGEDVDSLLQTRGAEGFEACMNEAPDGLTFCMNTLREEYAPRDIMAWAKSFLSELSDTSLRAFYLPRIASGLGLSEADFRRDAGAAAPQQRNPRHQPRQAQRAEQQPGTGVGKDFADDRYFLRFSIQYPDYVPELAKRGMTQVLRTPWAQALWEKLETTQQGQVASLLNEQEKGFYIQCREEFHENVLSGRELLEEWNHICHTIALEQEKLDKRQLTEAIRQAQQSGDTERALQLLALKESRRRDDEQH